VNDAFKCYVVLPPDQVYTDPSFCAGDASNSALGRSAVKRAEGDKLEPITITGSTLPRDVEAIRVQKPPNPNDAEMPREIHTTISSLLREDGGVYVVEYKWFKDETTSTHCVCVNCDWRFVGCNTLGWIPFNHSNRPGVAESGATHAAVQKSMRFRKINRIWQLKVKHQPAPTSSSEKKRKRKRGRR
jgi:hypothetical protein